jgi:hypothetical protein
MNEQSTAAWSPKQERVALLIAAGRSIKAAAVEADCGERTVHTWLEDPRYRTLVSELRHRMLDEAVGTLAEATNEAVGMLRKLLDEGNSSVRLRAALGILEAAVRMRRHVEFEARILRLEQDTAQDRSEGHSRIAIPDVDGRWIRTPSYSEADGGESPRRNPHENREVEAPVRRSRGEDANPG